MEGVEVRGGKGKRLFFASFIKQLFFCFLCVCKKKRKRVDLDEVRDCFKNHTRREEGRIVVWIAQNIIPPLCDQVFLLCFLSVFLFVFVFGSFSPLLPLSFFWVFDFFSFCLCVFCLVCLLFATLNPCSSHLFLSCLFFLSWVS